MLWAIVTVGNDVCFPIDFVVCRFHNCFMGQVVSQIEERISHERSGDCCEGKIR